MTKRTLIALALVPALLTPLALAARSERPRPEPSPAATPVGPPVSCIQLSQVNESKVRDDWTIDFVGHGNHAWRNNLRSRCSGLKIANAITYKTSLNQLCSTDIVYSLETTGGDLHRGPACSLGQFVPVELAR
jgi:hypothetical protein